MNRTIKDVLENLDFVGCDNATARELCAEIERLRGLLQWWIDAGPDADWDDYEQRVCEALGDAPDQRD